MDDLAGGPGEALPHLLCPEGTPVELDGGGAVGHHQPRGDGVQVRGDRIDGHRPQGRAGTAPERADVHVPAGASRRGMKPHGASVRCTSSPSISSKTTIWPTPRWSTRG